MLRFADRQLRRIRWNRGDVAEHLGRYLSTPKPDIVFSPSRRRSFRIKNKTIQLLGKTQFLYLGSRFFINGEVLRPRAGQRRALALLADQREAPGGLLARAGLEPLILDWCRAGYARIAKT
jgi:hypothetical protein